MIKRTLMLLAAVGGTAALAGCVGFVPAPVPVGVHVEGGHGGHHTGPPPRAWRDRDGDGVPNRYDRRPRNPYRY